jgi:lipopolysaccharide export system permease protein
MNISMTLSRYMAKNYLFNTLSMLFGLLSIVYLFDTVELLRRASKHDDMSLGLVLQMGILKLPEVGQVLFPFAILFSAMLTFWQFNRRSELVVLRASGFSVWQFLMPIALLALMIGVLQITIINPVGALLIGKYEQLESEYLSKQDNQIALFREGLWLRQTIDGGPFEEQNDLEQGYVILHAKKINQEGWVLRDVTVFYFGEEDNFLLRLDAPKATLEKGRWLFENAHTHDASGQDKQSPYFALPTQLTINDVEESFSSPESMSFWNLPGHIQTLESTGFETSRLRVHYHNLLSQPLFLAAMVLLAATVAMRPPRNGGTLILFGTGIFIGFVIFFMSSYLQALGYSSQIPPILSAWSPAIICFLLGLSMIIHLEDG